MTRLTIVVMSLMAISLILVCQVSARINEENVMGVWLFDEGSGDTANDASPNGFDGEIVGAQWEEDGVFGSCLEFDGTDDYVDCGENDKLDYMGDGNFSIVAWVRVLTPDASYHNIVSKKLGFNASDKGWMAWLDFRSAGALQLRINDGTTGNDDVPTCADATLMGTIQDEEWHHIGWIITEPGKFFGSSGLSVGTELAT